MKEKISSWIRPSGKWTDIFPIALILTVIVMFAGDTVGYIIFTMDPVKKAVRLVAGSRDVAVFMTEYLFFVGIWIVFFLVCGIVKWDRPFLARLAPNKNGNNLKGVLAGVLLGFGTNVFCILMSVIMGDISLYFFAFDPVLFFLFLLAVCIQSGAEEILCRVFLYQKLRRRYRDPRVAIIGNSMLFTILHLLNPGITVISIAEITLIGIIFSLLVYYYDSVWAAIMYHAAWNFTQSIAFGLPNSGIVSAYSLFKLEAASATNGLFYNVNFGVEGSGGILIVDLLLAVFIILINRNKPEKYDGY